ncbi:hypothetical protein Fot_14599 [Forsythia ovata]|uniref:Uncharacterized protein n=1 Tax=Forsythia ovata TaxID=205694 RepID=A0ABD1W6T0_9LAMI
MHQRSLKPSLTCTLACISMINGRLLDKQVLAKPRNRSLAHTVLIFDFIDIALKSAATYKHWQNKELERRTEPLQREVEEEIIHCSSPTSCTTVEHRKLEIAGRKKKQN